MESRRRAQAADCEPSEDQACISQASYCRGYSGEDPPLPIPNREVKLTIADGTDPPVGRVGSRGSSKPRASRDARGFFCCWLLLQCRLESAETERHRGLDEPTSPFTSRAARNVGGQCSSCRFASPPPARPPAQFRFRTRARTAAATGVLRPCCRRQRGLRSFAIEGQLLRRCPFLVFRERTFGKWLIIRAHPPHSERITFRYVWILLARRRSEAVPLQVRPRTVAGRPVRCSRSAKIL